MRPQRAERLAREEVGERQVLEKPGGREVLLRAGQRATADEEAREPGVEDLRDELADQAYPQARAGPRRRLIEVAQRSLERPDGDLIASPLHFELTELAFDRGRRSARGAEREGRL